MALVLLAATGSVGLTVGQGSPAVPVDPIPAILDAFEAYDLVALADPHGNDQAHAFRLSLIGDTRFAESVNDIVIEWGNALYQEVADRFVRGDEVTDRELRQVWRNTTQPGLQNELPIIEEFFHAVREVNASLPADRQLRILLGDPPIHWASIQTRDDHQRFLYQRDTYPSNLIQREVLDRGRRALAARGESRSRDRHNRSARVADHVCRQLVSGDHLHHGLLVLYGGMHLQRHNLFSNYELVDDFRLHTLVQQLERETEANILTVWIGVLAALDELQPDVASWPAPSLAYVRDTLLGAADFTFYYRFDVPRSRLQNGKIVPIPEDEWGSLAMEDQFDALLYLGPPSAMTESERSPGLCTDSEYMATRRERLTLVGMHPLLEELEQWCRDNSPQTP